ncbi:MAG: bifunctional nuclease family protein [Calditrichaeota bacterium]|nr:bifunctional nuclease family protein [Calditrichota bacterium]MCB9089302.1 bifunctional nuclease family protein [Calditrichia bacterium]
MIEAKINGLFLTQSQASGVILKEIDGERTLPIIIGEYEAQSIALGLENIMPPRPITHDLLLNMLETLDAKIERVIISDLRSNTYYAIIQVRSQARMYDIDARPSDAIALAVRQNIQIFIEEEVMRKGAYDAKEVEDLGERQIDTHQEQLDRLKKELDEAVEKEEYEKAAKLRDHIKKLESRQ